MLSGRRMISEAKAPFIHIKFTWIALSVSVSHSPMGLCVCSVSAASFVRHIPFAFQFPILILSNLNSSILLSTSLYYLFLMWNSLPLRSSYLVILYLEKLNFIIRIAVFFFFFMLYGTVFLCFVCVVFDDITTVVIICKIWDNQKQQSNIKYYKRINKKYCFVRSKKKMGVWFFFLVFCSTFIFIRCVCFFPVSNEWM